MISFHQNLIRSGYARVAQLVEQRIENPRVGGSIPPPGTIFLNEINYLMRIEEIGGFIYFGEYPQSTH